MTYAVRLERGPDGVGAYVPDLPGLGVVGDDDSEAIRLLHTALQWHIEALLKDGESLPEAVTSIGDDEWVATVPNDLLADATGATFITLTERAGSNSNRNKASTANEVGRPSPE